ncbi:hypothetical protein DFS34DRAFT_650246 [Phlyctochytrium arcticum]|nr:hypothetical protein DFS34DRAFT_650246 [Phlyctochytrium arcticum]
MRFLTTAFLGAFLVHSAVAQNHTVPDAIECGPDILVDDFAKSTKAALPGETLIRSLNLLGGDYGSVNVTFEVDTTAKNVKLVAGPTGPGLQNFFFAKFDAGACYDLTNMHAVAFDLVAPVGATFSITLTQKSPNCTERLPDDSEYIPLTKYVTPNGQLQTVVLPWIDFKKNSKGDAFDFVHLKDWTLVDFKPQGATFLISNIRLQRACKNNGPYGVPAAATTTFGAATPTGGANTTPTGQSEANASSSASSSFVAGAGVAFGTIIFALIAMFAELALPEPCGTKRQREPADTSLMTESHSFPQNDFQSTADICVNNLSCEELRFVRDKAQTRLMNDLLVDCMTLPKSDEEYSYLWPKRLQNERLRNGGAPTSITEFYGAVSRIRIDTLEVPELVEECVQTILADFSKAQQDVSSTIEGPFVRILSPLFKLLASMPAVLPVDTHEVWKSIVVLNMHDETAAVIPTAHVRYPTSKHEDLLRDAMLLLPIANRQFAQYLLSFACHLCRQIPASQQSATKHNLALLLGPFLTHAKHPDVPSAEDSELMSVGGCDATYIPISEKPARSAWPSRLFELLMYAGDRRSSLDNLQSSCRLWCIPGELVNDMRANVRTPLRTPRRKGSSISHSHDAKRGLIGEPDQTKRASGRRVFEKTSSGTAQSFLLFQKRKKNWILVNEYGQNPQARMLVDNRELW